MTEVAHQTCPHCNHKGCYSYNEDKNVYQCFSCGAKGRLRKDYDNMSTVVDYTPKRIEDPASGNYVAMRGITAKTMEDFGVQTYSDRQEYVYPSGGIKVRKLDEKVFYTKDGFKGDELFGMNLNC